MYKTMFHHFLILCFFITVNASAQIKYTKQHTLPTSDPITTGRLAAQGVIDAGNGNSIAVYNVDEGGKNSIYITKIDANGNTLCTTPIEYSGSGSGTSFYANSITKAGEDRFLITGKWITSDGESSLYLARINSLGTIVNYSHVALSNIGDLSNIEGINVIPSNTNSDEFIVTAVTGVGSQEKLLLLKILSHDAGTGYVIWSQLFNYSGSGSGTAHALPTSIVAISGGYIVVGRHAFVASGQKKTWGVFAVEVNETGVMQGNFNVYYITSKQGDINTFIPAIQHFPSTGKNVLVFGSSVPSPFPQVNNPPSPTATSIGAAIGLDANFNNSWAYLYWLSDAEEMAFHSIYKATGASYNKSDVLGFVKRNDKYSPVFSAIDADDGQLNRFLTGFWEEKAIFSPFAMSDNSATNPYQYIGQNGDGRSSNILSLIRINSGGRGNCDYNENFDYEEMESSWKVYLYGQSSVELYGVHPSLDLPKCYVLEEEECQ